MTNQEKRLSFTFENPNTAAAFEEAFRKVMLDKLAAQRMLDSIMAA